MILTLIGLSIVIFAMLRLVPGNIADILFDAAGFIDPAEKAQLEEELGLAYTRSLHAVECAPACAVEAWPVALGDVRHSAGVVPRQIVGRKIQDTREVSVLLTLDGLGVGVDT
ncbi:MAG: hypothetical protein EBT51_11480 [Flavobacteriaceae bacterium]|nr:hypothetical protein [Flavobacteriaceae bacterium]